VLTFSFRGENQELKKDKKIEEKPRSCTWKVYLSSLFWRLTQDFFNLLILQQKI